MEVKGQLHAPNTLPPGDKGPGTHWIGDCVGPIASLAVLEKRKICPYQELNHIPLAVQPTA
jgi:hypothetical protein